VQRTAGGAVDAAAPTKPAAATIGSTRSAAVESGDLTFPSAGPVVNVPAGLLPGVRVGRYEIVALLGAGAMGVVFEARDTELDRTVALKLVQSRVRDRQLAQVRLRQEAQAMARLSHPGVASVFDIGVFDDQLFIAMELVRGHTLRDLVGTADRSWRDTLALAIAAGRGLAAAHEAGVVHRDFKPDNVLVRADGAVRVSDFGLACAVHDATHDGAAAAAGSPLVTTTGVAGTPAYMAPESFHGTADALTDQYALAVTMYELIEGKRPWAGRGSRADVRARLAADGIRAWERREVPRSVRAAIERGFSADRAARWSSVGELCAELERAGRRSHRWRAIAGITAGVLAVAGIALAVRPTLRATATAPTFATAVQQQLTFSGEATSPVLSHDGHRLAYVVGHDATTVAVHDLARGRVTRAFDDGIRVNYIAWSPDDTQLLVGEPYLATLVRANGTEQSKLAAAYRMGWSFDGSQLLATDSPQNPGAMKRIDTRTGGIQSHPVTLPGALWMIVSDWSGSERPLVIAEMQGHGYALWTLGTDGSDPRKIYQDDRSTEVRDAMYAAHGRAIYYQRLRDQTAEVVRLALDAAGNVTDERVVFSPPTLSDGFAISQDEQALVYTRSERSNAVAVTVAGRRTVLSADTRQKRAAMASHDGRRIAFIAGAGTRGQIVIAPADGGAAGQILPVAEGRPLELVWAPRDDRLAYTVDTTTGVQLWTVTLADGVSHRITTSTIASDGTHQLEWTARDEILFQTAGNRNFGIVAPGKPERLLVAADAPGWMFSAQASPDGGRIAVNWNRKDRGGVWIVSLDGGAAHPIYSGWAEPVGWSADGASVLVETDRGATVVAVDAAGSGRSRVVVSAVQPHTTEIRMLPGGEGFVALEESWRSDLWVASLDGRVIDVPSAQLPPATPPNVVPAVRNGSLATGPAGSAPADWMPAGPRNETAKVVDSCGDASGPCTTVAQGQWLEQRIDAAAFRGRAIRLHVRARAEIAAYVQLFQQTRSGLSDGISKRLEPTSWSTIELDANIHANTDAVVIRLVAEARSRAWFRDVSLELVER